MSDEKMTIREMCDTFDVTPRTLRFYEAKELLHPIREGQKRLFTKRDRARLTLIKTGKRFGFSLEDIRLLLDIYDSGDQKQEQIQKTHELGVIRLAEMIAERDNLNKKIDEIGPMLDHCRTQLVDFDLSNAA